MREAAAAQRFERAAWLRRRRERLALLLRRAGRGLALTPRARCSCSPTRPDGERWEAFWLVGGRVADWGPLPPADEIAERSAAALRGAGAPLQPHEIAQARVAAAWIAANEPHSLDLAPLPSAARTRALRRPRGAACAEPAQRGPGQGACRRPWPGPVRPRPRRRTRPRSAAPTRRIPRTPAGALTLAGVP